MRIRILGIKFGKLYIDKKSNHIVQEITIKNKVIAIIGILWWLFKGAIKKKIRKITKK